MPSVQILLAVYQGEQFLEEQLLSLANQTIDDVHILASDDGSTDRSKELLESAQKTWKKGTFKIIDGPQKGFAANFRSLIEKSNHQADYYAYCDQDDVWDNDKLEQAMKWHMGRDATLPTVCGSRSRMIDASGKFIGHMKESKRPPSFENAITQNLMPGHTMVMNKAARDLLARTANHIGLISHDYWIYLIVTGVGGVFHYSATPRVSYRQHSNNVVGNQRGLRSFFWRFDRLISGEVKRNTDIRISALEECADLLIPAAQSSLKYYKESRSADTIAKRWAALKRSGAYRQSLFGRLSLKIDCIIGML